MSKVAQLRVLTIQAGEMDAFIDAWKKTILPLRRKHGFQTDQAWIIPERSEFHWILSYSGSGTWDEMDEEYYQEFIRTQFEPDILRYIERGERWFIQPVALGPGEAAYSSD